MLKIIHSFVHRQNDKYSRLAVLEICRKYLYGIDVGDGPSLTDVTSVMFETTYVGDELLGIIIQIMLICIYLHISIHHSNSVMNKWNIKMSPTFLYRFKLILRVNVWSTIKLSDAQRFQLLNSRATSRSQFIKSIFKTRGADLATFDGLILLSKSDFESGLGLTNSNWICLPWVFFARPGL